MIAESDITFAGSFLDRADRLRPDASELAARLADPQTRIVPFWHGKPLFDLTETGPRLVWLSARDPLIADSPEPPVFLGLDEKGTAHFAADLSHIAPPDQSPADFVDRRTLDLSDTRKFIDLRAIMGEIDHRDAGIAAAAKGIFEWRLAHRFCPNCGHRVEIVNGGWRHDCPACGRSHFPRTDPVVIMLVLDGDRVLLGREPSWPEKMYSLLAGFVEPGETIEEAVRREVLEETAIIVGEVRYLTSQPWPFPASLMIGCVAMAETSIIDTSLDELDHALWVSRAEMVEALAGRHEGITPARKGAIARVILRAWAEGAVSGF